jgi:hypothetical protein
MFVVTMGVNRGQLEDMSVPEMVDHVDYWHSMNRGPADG